MIVWLSYSIFADMSIYKLNKDEIRAGNYRQFAKAISAVENEYEGYFEFLENLQIDYSIPVVGITGPPGAGKSSLLNAILKELSSDKKIAILAVDPSSPFTHGSVLGDRFRMNDFFEHPNVYIRSLATRGNLGGLSPKSIEISDVLRSAGFDIIFIETVGVGQSEVEIATLADTTVLVLNPGAGDDIQALKSGILEIADIYVINKSDQPNADVLARHLYNMLNLRPVSEWMPPVIKTIATEFTGIQEMIKTVYAHQGQLDTQKRQRLLYEKAVRLIAADKMKRFDYVHLQSEIQNLPAGTNFYHFLKKNYLERV